jgi:hypothetical protein
MHRQSEPEGVTGGHPFVGVFAQPNGRMILSTGSRINTPCMLAL